MQSFGKFVRDEKGAVTVEFTMLFPFFILLMIFFVDACVIYLTHTEINNVARDAARRMSTGELTTPEEVVAYAGEHLYLGSRTYTVQSDFGANMRVIVEVPMQQAVFFGVFFRPVLGESLLVISTMRREPLITAAS